MQRMIVVDTAEEVACPNCSHAFALSEDSPRALDAKEGALAHSYTDGRAGL